MIEAEPTRFKVLRIVGGFLCSLAVAGALYEVWNLSLSGVVFFGTFALMLCDSVIRVRR